MTEFYDVRAFRDRAAAAAATTAPCNTARPQPLPRSGMGVASLVMAIISIISTALLFSVLLAVARTYGAAASVEQSPFFYLGGAWLFATGLICVVGIVFGIGGLLQSGRRRGVAAAGLCLNIAIPVGLMFVLLVGQTSRDLAIERGELPRIQQSTPSAPETPPWRTPGARAFQCLTAAMGATLFAYYGVRGRRRRRATESASRSSTPCWQCGKFLALGSTYCRRCGCAI